jgi:hypothetical protein
MVRQLEKTLDNKADNYMRALFDRLEMLPVEMRQLFEVMNVLQDMMYTFYE